MAKKKGAGGMICRMKLGEGWKQLFRVMQGLVRLHRQVSLCCVVASKKTTNADVIPDS